MASGVDNLVLEQLRLIREELGALRGELSEFKAQTKAGFEDLQGEILGAKTMMFGLATVIGHIDKRVETLEQKIGA